MLPQNGHDVVGRVAVVHDERQPRFPGYVQLANEDVPLYVSRRVVVVIIEPDLADGDDFRVSANSRSLA